MSIERPVFTVEVVETRRHMVEIETDCEAAAILMAKDGCGRGVGHVDVFTEARIVATKTATNM